MEKEQLEPKPAAEEKVASEAQAEVAGEVVAVVADLAVVVVVYVYAWLPTAYKILTWTKAVDENGEPIEPLPLADVTNEANQGTDGASKDQKARAPRPQKQRGPPEDGTPSTTKVMVANLPYDLSEEKVCA